MRQALTRRLGIISAPLRMDSQAKYAVVARGEADIYLRLPTRTDYREKIWDHAAGSLIVAEAGGTVTDIHGRALEFHHGRELIGNRGVIVSNGRLHTQVIRAIEAIGIGSARASILKRETRALSTHPPKIEKSPGTTYRKTRAIFLRGLGLTYMAAFASMAGQVDGLISSNGILPARDYFEHAVRVLGLGPKTYWRLPSLLWLNASDHALHALCWGGLFLGAMLFAGIMPGLAPCSFGLRISRSRSPDRFSSDINGTRFCSRRGCSRCSWHPGVSG